MRVAICDDNLYELESTCSLLKKYQDTKFGLDIKIEKFQDGNKLLESIDKTGGYDIYILDIVMPEMTGIELGEKINLKDSAPNIILLTTSPDFGVDSYTISAKNYLLKPCTEERFFAAMNKLIGNFTPEKQKCFIVNIAGGVYAANYNDIVFIEYYKHKIIEHLSNGEIIESITQRRPFSTLTEDLIKDGRFIQVSASHVVNMQYIKKFTSRYIEMMSGEQITLSRLYANTRSTYMDYMFDKTK